MATPWDKFYDTGEVDFSDLYAPDVRLGTGSEHADRYLGSMLGLAEAKTYPYEPATALIQKNIEEVKGTPLDEMKVRINQRTKSVLATAVQGQLNTLSELYAETGDTSLVDEAEAIVQETDSVEELPLGSRVAVGALAALKDDRLTDIDRLTLARQAQLAMVGEFMEAADLGGWALLGSMVPLRNSYQFVKEGGVDALGEYKQKVSNFRAMLPEDQIRALPEIMAEIWKMSGENAFMFQDRILPFIDAEDMEKVYEAFAWDAVDAASILPITKLARWVKAAVNPARFAKAAGKTKVGGKIVAEAATDPKAAETVGMSQVDAAASARPFNAEGAIPEIVDGLSPDAQAAIVEGLTEGRKYLDRVIYDPNLIIKRSALTPKEIAETQAKYIREYGGNARIVESDPNGFTVEIDIAPEYGPNTLDWSEVPNRIAELQGDLRQYRERLSDLKTAYGEPPPEVADGYVRVYHGGVPGEGSRWFSVYLDYAKGYASKSGNAGKVLYTDIPEEWLGRDYKNGIPGLQSIELPPNISQQAKVYTTRGAEDLEEYKYLENISIAAEKELQGLQKEFRKAVTPKKKAKTITKKIRYTRDDVGVLDAIEFSKASAAFNSPERYINQMLEGAVQESTVIGFTQQQLRNYFEQAVERFVRGLGKEGKRKVDAVVLQGDADKIHRYSTADLMQGITTKEGLIRLTDPNEIMAYHGIRDVFDTAYLLKNRQLRRELEFENYKSVKLNVGGESVISFVKPAFGEGGHVLKALPDDVRKLYDFASDRVIEVGDAAIIARRIESGNWHLLKSKYPIEDGDEVFEYILAKSSNIKRLPDRVLGYRAGYVPRVYKNVFFIAESVGKKVVNGTTKHDYREVKRYFDSNSEAEKWADIQRAKGETIVVRPGREWLEMHPEFKQDYEAAVFGGLYSGKRADTVIPFGLKGTDAEHIGAFEAMDKALSHVATRLPINEFRMGMIRRFLNSARDPVTGKSVLANPGDWRSEIVGFPKTSKEYIGLQSMREWMEDQFRIPTAQERYFGSLTARLASAIDGKWLRGPKRMFGMELNPRIHLMNLGNKDVFASMRGLAFHALLGWFNPAQLYVQALGASMAFSVAPHKALYLVPRYLALRAAVHSDNPAVWARTGVAAGLGAHDAKELVRAFRKSGIMDSVRSTADFDAAVRGYGITRSAFSRAADRGLLFFREGETLVRAYGWLLAHSDFLAKKGKGYVLTDADIDSITKTSLKYTMNLNRANRAHWQKGALSIPTQFMQITAKFIENMGYSLKNGRGSWSPWEKSKVMSGQLVLFGAAGVPFGQWAAQGVAEWAGSDSDYGLAITDPRQIAAIRGGIAEMALYDWTGESLAISQRVSIPSGIESFVDMVLRSDATLGEKLAGAFGEVPGRFAEALNDIAPIFVGYTEEMENFDGPQMAMDIAVELGDITSSFRNVHKAFMWERAKALLDNKGNPIIPLDPDEDHSIIFAKAMGLEPRALEDYYNMTRFNSLNKKDLQNVADAWIKVAKNYANSPQMGTPEGRARVGNMISWLNRGLTEEQRADVAEMVANKLKKDDYKITKELIDAVENVRKSRGQTSAGYKGSLELNSLLVPDKLTDSQEQRDAE